MHSLDFVGQRGRAERMCVLGSFVNVAKGHLLSELLLAFRDKLVACFSASGIGACDMIFRPGLSLLNFRWGLPKQLFPFLVFHDNKKRSSDHDATFFAFVGAPTTKEVRETGVYRVLYVHTVERTSYLAFLCFLQPIMLPLEDTRQPIQADNWRIQPACFRYFC